jgi:hypothetical protein
MGLISRCVQSIHPTAAYPGRLEGIMNTVQGTMLGLTIAIGGWACSAQQATIPFKQLEQDAQLTARLTVPGNEAIRRKLCARASRPRSGSPNPQFELLPAQWTSPGDGRPRCGDDPALHRKSHLP